MIELSLVTLGHLVRGARVRVAERIIEGSGRLVHRAAQIFSALLRRLRQTEANVTCRAPDYLVLWQL